MLVDIYWGWDCCRNRVDGALDSQVVPVDTEGEVEVHAHEDVKGSSKGHILEQVVVLAHSCN